ncbi:MAG: glycosyltransferase family 2 protein [Candidatus Theseobacter exili]|nr:glycosyltransferase family 2 protein [Candidatus Theseobacter exili]
MYKNKTIAVVVPAYNEEKLIGKVIETMPNFVDKIIVVDDLSKDKTFQIASEYAKHSNRIILIRHEDNRGVGGAITTGYHKAVELEMDVTAVMAGDYQMDPTELHTVLSPVIEGKCDYCKGNRLFSGQAWEMIPHYRYLGNAFLTLLTKIASGYWHITDSQTGYTAISLKALTTIQLDKLYKRYGYPNHLLVMLNIYHFPVQDVPVRPVYGVGEKSGIKLHKVIPTLSWLLTKCFFWRLKEKYIIRDFHPLVFFYLYSLLSIPIGTAYLFFIIFMRIFGRCIIANKTALKIIMTMSTPAALILTIFIILSGIQMLFFAMWFDMEYNKELK